MQFASMRSRGSEEEASFGGYKIHFLREKGK